ncbi:MAG: V-type ATPase subunit [Oscillospiraceae bacterium]|nr:V-type ATPase subunit [Oscillospiraceae bacterium]
MAKAIRDTDYLAISTRIRAMENGLLSRERMEQLLEARTEEDTAKLLQESGYPDLDTSRPEAMDAAIAAIREETFLDLADGAPDTRYLDFFRVRYDYHHAKAAVKASALGTNPDTMFSGLGRVAASELMDAVRTGDTDSLPGELGAAVAEAKDILETTRDPQLSDIALDRRMYADLRDIAADTGSAFLQGYVRIMIDAENLRALVRTLRMGRNADFLKGVLLDGGELDTDSVLSVANGESLLELYAPTPLAIAAEYGAEAVKGASLTAFEKLCDDAVMDYLTGARFVPFGDAPLVAYLAAKETEYTNLRILLLGRAAGLSADVIRSRLRAGYV